MKKLILATCAMIFAFQIAIAQTMTISGKVKNEKGAALPFAFVQDKQIKTAVYTDSLGNFSINSQPGSMLQFSLNGYADTSIEVKQNVNSQVVLRYDGSVKSDVTSNVRSTNRDVTASDAFSGHIYTAKADNSAYNEGSQMQFDGGSFPIAKEKEEAHGSRYLFTEWGDGSVINPKDVLIKDPAYVFNYDKMGGNLVVTHDKKNVIAVDRDQIKSFTIYNELKQPFLFERFPAVDANHFAQVLSDGNKYKILKITKTKFVAANYQTNGITETGKQYDEYVDESTYYILNVQTNEANKFLLKKKSIKDAFGGDNKAEGYLNTHKEGIDDQYLKGLGDYVNN